MKRWMWVVLAAQLAAGTASAQALHSLQDLAWKFTPSGNDFARYYPERAQKAGQPGWAVVECQTETTGDLKACQVLGQGPKDGEFGEAGLKLSRMFKVDISKVAPETLVGGVVTIPIIMTMAGGPTPLRNDIAGGPALLLTPSAKGTSLCPTPTAPKQTCTPHRFNWATRPALVETAPFVRKAAATPASTEVICPIGEDSKLGRCMLAGPADPSQVEAMTGLIPLFTAPSRAEDKAPAKDGFVLIQFDWPALKLAVETSVLTKAP